MHAIITYAVALVEFAIVPYDVADVPCKKVAEQLVSLGVVWGWMRDGVLVGCTSGTPLRFWARPFHGAKERWNLAWRSHRVYLDDDSAAVFRQATIREGDPRCVGVGHDDFVPLLDGLISRFRSNKTTCRNTARAGKGCLPSL